MLIAIKCKGKNDYKMQYSIEISKNTKKPDIDDYVSSRGSVYHLTGWAMIIKEVFGHDMFHVFAKDENGNICGVLPLVNLKSSLFGNFMVSMPYFNYGGVISEKEEVDQLIIQDAIRLCEEIGAQHMELREVKKRNNDWPVRTDKVNMILELPESIDEIGKSIGSKKRSQIRRPIKEGVKVHAGGMDLLDDFYRVFSENMRDLGTPVYSKTFFLDILINFPDKTKIIMLSSNGIPISVAFLIGHRDMLEIPWASTLRRFNHFSPNMLLYWEVLSYAVESGYKYFDFGRSSIDSGTYKFKKQWGAIPKQLYWHYWMQGGGGIPVLNPTNPKYKLAISVWQKLPLFITNMIGPMIIKNLP